MKLTASQENLHLPQLGPIQILNERSNASIKLSEVNERSSKKSSFRTRNASVNMANDQLKALITNDGKNASRHLLDLT